MPNYPPFPNSTALQVPSNSPTPSSPKSPYENVSPSYLTYPMPQSPRTRIKTIVGKERAERGERTERRDNCEIIENRMAISDFQNGMSDGNKFQGSKTPKENTCTKNKENQSPYSHSNSSSALETPAPPKPPRSPRIERSVLGDSPTINKMNSVTHHSVSSSQVSTHGEESLVTEQFDSLCSEVMPSSVEKTSNYENSQSLIQNSRNSTFTQNKMECSTDSSVCASPNDQLVRTCSDTEATVCTTGDEGRGSNKVLEEHIMKTIQDTLNIDVSFCI